MPPKIDRWIQRIQAGNHCRTCRRQPRHRFKKCIGKTHGRHIEINRHRRHDSKSQPQHQYQGESITRPQFTVETQRQHPSYTRHQQYGQSRIGKHEKRAVVIKIRHQCRHGQQQWKQQPQLGQYMDNRHHLAYRTAQSETLMQIHHIPIIRKQNVSDGLIKKAAWNRIFYQNAAIQW